MRLLLSGLFFATLLQKSKNQKIRNSKKERQNLISVTTLAGTTPVQITEMEGEKLFL